MRNYAAAQLLPYQRAKVAPEGVKDRRERDAWDADDLDDDIARAMRN